ncbi:putative protein [Arabidopsis thaliana]|uniref:At3g62640 n=1 Tax=Arabidopsis thaliana TaxID=3702 RepID=Q9LZK1_ARATH|nr:DUF3511 domain protein (DUF3511) [Arabidopsis thaliana]AAO42938.1 At3g62640 [Arabidopsis thaliana]AEE80374.1 DUF3511 domain protein (DUF3511) [Arabidopsis thaliana]BAC43198.1 unknown protein [Arabidopsis thaliana]CAB83114.1 putative protein [Arabidopsis thaliana]|eukprot:NP_191823.1 DUF3511 domain protein (DUF3511) [Arabidopsis thaliana]
MDGFGSHPRTLAVDQWMDIVNGKGYGVGGTTQVYSTRPDSPKFQPSIPPPPGSTSKTRTTATPWRLIDAETKRKKRIATYKTYALEGKVKSTVKKGFHWIKDRYSHIIHG